MIKETTILYGITKEYDSVDAFFTENGLAEYRTQMQADFASAGLDITDDTKVQSALTSDSSGVKITVAYADQAEQDAFIAISLAADVPDTLPLVEELSSDHLF